MTAQEFQKEFVKYKDNIQLEEKMQKVYRENVHLK